MNDPATSNPAAAGSATVVDELVAANERYAARFDAAGLPVPPRRKLAVVACMDARMNVYDLLGLAVGDAHVIRNAGGVVTDDAIRSLAISQHLLGTEAVVVVQHTECGMMTFTDDDFRQRMRDATGVEPSWSPEAFADLDESVRRSVERIRASPFVPRTENVTGFVYDVRSGRLRAVG